MFTEYLPSPYLILNKAAIHVGYYYDKTSQADSSLNASLFLSISISLSSGFIAKMGSCLLLCTLL